MYIRLANYSTYFSFLGHVLFLVMNSIAKTKNLVKNKSKNASSDKVVIDVSDSDTQTSQEDSISNSQSNTRLESSRNFKNAILHRKKPKADTQLIIKDTTNNDNKTSTTESNSDDGTSTTRSNSDNNTNMTGLSSDDCKTLIPSSRKSRAINPKTIEDSNSDSQTRMRKSQEKFDHAVTSGDTSLAEKVEDMTSEQLLFLVVQIVELLVASRLKDKPSIRKRRTANPATSKRKKVS